MIDRFNFYDLYGYLLPGAALLGLLALPFALAGRVLPALEWSSALVSLVGAYLAGHVLQILARRGLPDQSSEHDAFLDPDNTELPADYRTLLQRWIRQDFEIDIRSKESRKLAFEMCRAAVQARETTSYAEQFQGLYALMRGLSAACLLGAAYHSGWTLAPLVTQEAWLVVAFGAVVQGALLFTAVAASAADDKTAARLAPVILGLVALLAATAGLSTAVTSTITLTRLAWQRIAFTVIPLVVLAFLFHRTYRAFATVFARTVVTAYMAKPRPSC